MTQPRILHIIASSRGGGATHVLLLAAEQRRRGYDISVIMPQDGGHVTAQDFAAHDIEHIDLPLDAGFKPRVLNQLRKIGAHAQLVHLHGARAAVQTRLALFALQMPPRIVYTIHGFAVLHYPPGRRRLQLALERLLARQVHMFIAVSHAERDDLQRARIARATKIAVVWNGIETQPFQAAQSKPHLRTQIRREFSLSPSTCLLIMPCRLHVPRDFTTLIHAVKAARQTGAELHLLIVGDGPLRPQVTAEIRTQGLSEHITLAGWRTDLPALYAAADIFVLTTWGWEGLPISLLEAMAAGLPVVATDAGGIPEALIHGETGLLAPRHAIEELSHALVQLANDAPLRKQMGDAGRRRLQAHFTVQKMTEQTLAVYNTILAAQS